MKAKKGAVSIIFGVRGRMFGLKCISLEIYCKSGGITHLSVSVYKSF